MAWSVQRVVPPAGEESWTVLDPAHDVVAPVDRFLAHLSAVERSPATVRSYAFDLRDFVELLDQVGLEWARLRLEDLGRFVNWLRLSPPERGGDVTHLARAVDHCSASTINRALKEIHRAGRPASVAGLARAAGVSRSWIYTQPDLLQQLQRHNQTARKPRQGPTERASDASLHRRLELAHQRIRQLAEDNQRLRDQLARAHGALRAANNGHVPTGRGKG